MPDEIAKISDLLGLRHVEMVHGPRDHMIMLIDGQWLRLDVRCIETPAQRDERYSLERTSQRDAEGRYRAPIYRSLPAADEVQISRVSFDEDQLVAIYTNTSAQVFDRVDMWLEFIKVPREALVEAVRSVVALSEVSNDASIDATDTFVYAVDQRTGFVHFVGGNYIISCDWLDLPYRAVQGRIVWNLRPQRIPQWLVGKEDV